MLADVALERTKSGVNTQMDIQIALIGERLGTSQTGVCFLRAVRVDGVLGAGHPKDRGIVAVGGRVLDRGCEWFVG